LPLSSAAPRDVARSLSAAVHINVFDFSDVARRRATSRAVARSVSGLLDSTYTFDISVKKFTSLCTFQNNCMLPVKQTHTGRTAKKPRTALKNMALI
jgi:hypothetical protein